MNIEKKIEDIFESIDKSKKLVKEATDVYSNVDFKDGVVGKSMPSKDKINTALLSDIQTAANNAGVKVDITTAISGHYSMPSRHPSGNAVDIALIDGKAVGYSTKDKVDKFVGELQKLGYVKNKEVNNPKAVLTFGFKGHDNHVHVSNTSDSAVGEIGGEDYSSTNQTTTTSTDQQTKSMEKEKSFYSDEFVDAIVSPYVKSFKGPMQEQKLYGKFGKDIVTDFNSIKLPKDSNDVVKSPVNGIRKKLKSNLSCSNQLMIEHDICGETFYLEYCGLKDIKPWKDSSIKKNEVLGNADSDVTVNLYDSAGSRKNLKEYIKLENCSQTKKTSYSSPKMEKEKKVYDDDILSAFVKTVASPLQTIDKILNPFQKKKVQENIQRIKKLL